MQHETRKRQTVGWSVHVRQNTTAGHEQTSSNLRLQRFRTSSGLFSRFRFCLRGKKMLLEIAHTPCTIAVVSLTMDKKQDFDDTITCKRVGGY